MPSGVTNFVVINPSALLAENDSAYQADALVTSGIPVNSPMPHQFLNKSYYQVSLMIAALGQMLAAKNFSPVDGTTPFTASPPPAGGTPEANLVAVLANILTTADYSAIASALFAGGVVNITSQSFYFKAPNFLGNFVIQGGVGQTARDPYTVNFPVAFSVIPVVVAIGDSGTTGISLVGQPPTTTTFSLQAAGGLHFQWIAVGK